MSVANKPELSKSVVVSTVVISKNLNASSEWVTSFLNVPFTPNYMVLKQLTYHHDGTETGIFALYSMDLGKAIASFYDGCSVSPDTYFYIPSRGLTEWSFKILRPDGTPYNAGGMISLTLEFGKY